MKPADKDVPQPLPGTAEVSFLTMPQSTLCWLLPGKVFSSVMRCCSCPTLKQQMQGRVGRIVMAEYSDFSLDCNSSLITDTSQTLKSS